MKLSENKVLRSKDALEIIFPNLRTQKVARLFCYWLSSKNRFGDFHATKSAVSKFADTLSQGIQDSQGEIIKFSRVNFYKTIIKTLVDQGFLQKNVPVWDPSSSRTLFIYAPHYFKIPLEPPSQGFWKLSYYICRKWNSLFAFEREITEKDKEKFANTFINYADRTSTKKD